MDPNIIIGIAGIVVGVVGIVAALWTYLHSRARLELTWSTEHNLLIENSRMRIYGLKITLHGKVIPSLKSTILTIKNTGNRDLDGENISRRGIRFTVGLSNGRCLGYNLLNADDENPNGFTIGVEQSAIIDCSPDALNKEVSCNEEKMKDKFVFGFAEMAKKEFAQIQILHTAEEDPIIDFLNGGLKKEGKIVSRKKQEFKYTLLAYISTPLVLVGCAFLFVFYGKPTDTTLTTLTALAGTITGAASILITKIRKNK